MRSLSPDVQVRVDAVTAALRGRSLPVDPAGQLPLEAAGLLSEQRLTALCLPRRLGGLGCGLSELVTVVRAVSMADPSTAWCLFIFATAPWLLSGGTDELVAEVYGDPGSRVGGALAPTGRARRVGDAFQLEGTWRFGSGVGACDWVAVRAVVAGDTTARSAFFVVPGSDVAEIAPWDGIGLRNSGSGAFSITDAAVPAHRVVWSPPTGPVWPEPQFRLPFRATFAAGAAHLLGVAAEMIDEFIRLAAKKTPTFGAQELSRQPGVSALVARCVSAVDAAAAFLAETVADLEGSVEDDTSPPGAAGRDAGLRQQARLRAAVNHVRAACLTAVDQLHLASGGSGVPDGSRLSTLFRDAHTASQHYMFSPDVDELAGAVLLGRSDVVGL